MIVDRGRPVARLEPVTTARESDDDRRLSRLVRQRACRSEAAVFAVIVYAKDEQAADFYRHHGFLPFASRLQSLWLPVATGMKLLES